MTQKIENLKYWESLNVVGLLSEKISGAEGTKLDEDFMEMERKVEVTNKSVFDLLSRTQEYLQPNPASRAKLNMLNTMSKIRGQVKTTGYPQTEGLLGDCMLRYGHELGDNSVFGGALVDVGEAMRQMADVKDSLDINVKQNFIDPLQNLQDKDLKEITHHLKKLEGRRLDFDYKKKRRGKIQEEEIQQAVEKFEESKELAERSMFNFLENDVRLSALIEAALEYHRQSSEILEELSGKLHRRISTASGRPKREFKPKSIRSSIETLDNNQHNGLTHSSSIRSTGTALTHTVTVFITSVFLFSFFCPDFSSHRHPLSFLLSLTDIQINNTVNGKSRYLFMKYS
uniref:SH3-domain GRB2-like 3a n=1 Tax=Cynoglossus semilaevis TaxID=244447 RepID=A0A3P8VEA2_CYNSE